MRKFFTLLLTTSVYFSALGQEAMRVVRCDAVDKNASIQNIYIDEDNQKWVGNEQGLVQVLDLGLGKVMDLPEDQTSVYKLPGGNANVNFSIKDFERIAGIELSGNNRISCAYYNAPRKELWLGTTESGAFKLSTSSNLKLIKSYNAKNSKLKTDQINTIKADPFGRIWIGTNDGLLLGKDDKWELLERYFNFTSIKLDSTNRTWLLADDLIGYVSRKKNWVPVELPEAALDGPIVDFTFDTKGYLWVVTEVVARIDLSNEDYDIYGPADYYTSQYATQIETDLDGGIWVATEDKGLYLIEPASAMTVNVLIDQALDCAGSQNNASLAVRVTGGISPFEYQWEGDLSGEKPGNLGQGTYIVTVTDSRGNSKIAKAEITDPSVKASVEMIEKESGLNQNNGKAEVTASQGQSPFSYEWDNGEKTKTAIQLTEGKHQVTVTDDNGCTTVVEVEMTRIIGELAVDIEQSAELKCYGDKNATLTAQVEGGKGPYQYIWSNGATSSSLENVGAGTYAVSITDGQGKTSEQTLEVTQPVEFKSEIEIIAPASTGQRDGIATLKIENGNKPFRYRWSNRASSDTIRNLAPGDYQLTVTDAKGCISFAEATVQENILELGAEIVYNQKVQCFGQPEANFKIVPKGGKGPYQFQWDGTTLAGDGSQGLLAGEYKVTITDATGQSFVKDIIIEEPAEIKVNANIISPPSVEQADGIVEMDVQGGVAPYQYSWNTGQTADKVEGLKAGQYTVEVTDANGCISTKNFELDENILELQVDINIADSIFCGGTPTGALVAEVKGGKGPFKYSWNDGYSEKERQSLIADFYYVTVEDAVGNTANSQIKLDQPPPLNLKVQDVIMATTDQTDGKALAIASGGIEPYTYRWSNGETNAQANQLPPGDVSVIVTDANGCEKENQVELGEDVQPIVSSIEVIQPITCAGDQDATLEVKIEGGKGPFSYQWNQGGLSGERVNNLGAGAYSVTITDAIGQESIVNYDLSDPDTLQLTPGRLFPSNPDVADGFSDAIVTGGEPTYTYQWDNGETTKEAARLPMGNHSLTVTDQRGCQTSAAFVIGEKLIPGLSMSNMVKNERIQMERIKFDTDSDSLKAEFFPVLDQVYEFLVNNPNVSIEIGGHTNNLPTDEYCDQLSRGRATAAAKYILDKGKEVGQPFSLTRIFYKGYGKKDPLYDNNTDEGLRKNIRIEMKIISIR